MVVGRSCESCRLKLLHSSVVHASGGSSDPVQLQSAGRSSCVYARHRCRLWKFQQFTFVRRLGVLFGRNAWFDSDYRLCNSLLVLSDVLTHFLRERGTRILKSICPAFWLPVVWRSMHSRRFEVIARRNLDTTFMSPCIWQSFVRRQCVFGEEFLGVDDSQL